jgi:hypothetical protein
MQVLPVMRAAMGLPIAHHGAFEFFECRGAYDGTADRDAEDDKDDCNGNREEYPKPHVTSPFQG